MNAKNSLPSPRIRPDFARLADWLEKFPHTSAPVGRSTSQNQTDTERCITIPIRLNPVDPLDAAILELRTAISYLHRETAEIRDNPRN